MMQRVVLLLCVLTLHGWACADNFPARGLKIIVPFGPGTGTDVLARSIGAKMAEALGQSVTIENREGAGGLIGTRALLASPADGYTLMLAANAFVVGPLLYEKAPYDPFRDFLPITKVATVPLVLITNNSLPFETMKELIAYAKANPRRLSFASSGKGTPSQLETELLKATYGIEMVEVPYKNQGQALTDLVGGTVDLYYPTLMAALPHVKSGRLRALAMGGSKRATSAMEIPTMAEALDSPGYDAHTWYGFVVAANTPMNVVTKLRTEINKAMQSTEVKERVSLLGGEIVSGSGEEFAKQMRTESQKWAKLIKKIGLQAD